LDKGPKKTRTTITKGRSKAGPEVWTTGYGMRIAVIGSGISGLAAARRLCPHHRVTVFEAGSHVGGHTHTIDLDIMGVRAAVDTGFIVFNDKTYPGFAAMLRDLGVASRPTSMGFSVRHDAAHVEYSGHSLGHLFAQRRNLIRPAFLRMARGIVRFGREAQAWLADGGPGRDPTLTLAGFLERGRFAAEVRDWYVVPMASAIWSASDSATLALPFAFFARFFDNHAFFDLGERPVWRTVVGGSREYVRALLPILVRHGCDVRTRTPVKWVRRSPSTRRYLRHEPETEGGVEVVTDAGRSERFDAVVLATHSDTALSILADPTPIEREILGAFPYHRNDAIVHTDTRVMPTRRKVWSAWNARLGSTPGERARVTYNMNILQGLDLPGDTQVMVTLNDPDAIDPAKVLRLISYEHPVYTNAGFASQTRQSEISGVSRTFYAGAYWRSGFHEDGFWSGERAAEQVLRWAGRLTGNAANSP
jgi:predicted NAD/FAD-binding protein